MLYYKCTVLVAVPNNIHKDWEDGGDEGFYLQDVVGDVGGYNPRNIQYETTGCHLAEVETISGAEFRKHRKAQCWPEGGV